MILRTLEQIQKFSYYIDIEKFSLRESIPRSVSHISNFSSAQTFSFSFGRDKDCIDV